MEKHAAGTVDDDQPGESEHAASHRADTTEIILDATSIDSGDDASDSR